MRKRHGEVKRIDGKRVATPEYRAWQNMRTRCLNPNGQDWADYGGRGITLDDPRWHVYENFLADMGRRPSPLHTLDRIDNDKGYSKANCRWLKRREQARNRGDYHVCNLAVANRIRKLYATGKYYQYQLADMFGLTQAHISQITRNVAWVDE